MKENIQKNLVNEGYQSEIVKFVWNQQRKQITQIQFENLVLDSIYLYIRNSKSTIDLIFAGSISGSLYIMDPQFNIINIRFCIQEEDQNHISRIQMLKENLVLGTKRGEILIYDWKEDVILRKINDLNKCITFLNIFNLLLPSNKSPGPIRTIAAGFNHSEGNKCSWEILQQTDKYSSIVDFVCNFISIPTVCNTLILFEESNSELIIMGDGLYKCSFGTPQSPLRVLQNKFLSGISCDGLIFGQTEPTVILQISYPEFSIIRTLQFNTPNFYLNLQYCANSILISFDIFSKQFILINSKKTKVITRKKEKCLIYIMQRGRNIWGLEDGNYLRVGKMVNIFEYLEYLVQEKEYEKAINLVLGEKILQDLVVLKSLLLVLLRQKKLVDPRIFEIECYKTFIHLVEKLEEHPLPRPSIFKHTEPSKPRQEQKTKAIFMVSKLLKERERSNSKSYNTKIEEKKQEIFLKKYKEQPRIRRENREKTFNMWFKRVFLKKFKCFQKSKFIHDKYILGNEKRNAALKYLLQNSYFDEIYEVYRTENLHDFRMMQKTIQYSKMELSEFRYGHLRIQGRINEIHYVIFARDYALNIMRLTKNNNKIVYIQFLNIYRKTLGVL